MIRSIRGRLQWWYGAVYAVSILAFGFVVYWRADRDVRERATLHAVSTAQFLEVALRSMPPQFQLPPERRLSNVTGARPFPPQPQEPGSSGVAQRPGDDRGPERGPPPFRDGRGPNGPPPGRNRGPDGGADTPGHPGQPWPGLWGPGPQNSFAELRAPALLDEDGNELMQPPLDRVDFAIWRPDGTLLHRSSDLMEKWISEHPRPETRSPVPEVSLQSGYLQTLMRGPHGATIFVRRSMRHDLSNLHRFGYQIAAMAISTLAVGLVGGWWISGRIVQPIQSISQTAASISAANLDSRIATDRLDAELVTLACVLNNTFERLESSFRRLTQFTADASHELRTPLAVIQSQIELSLSQRRTPDAYQQTLATCLRSSERMRSLVDGLLLLARTDAERVELRPQPVDLRTIAEDAVVQLQSRASEAGVELECSTPDEPVVISGDARFLLQVPSNLIDNALQHTTAGGRIQVDVCREINEAVLTVRDTGCGIAPEHIPHLFERFYRVDTARSRQSGGSGLGLSICRSLVEAHGGTIHCESRPGEGSVFSVRLPLMGVRRNLPGVDA